jgi:SAM-dependent methyltransferase
MERLEILDANRRWELHRTILSKFLNEYFSAWEGKVKILEAGCGEMWNLDLDRMDYVLTGIDVSRAALETRRLRAGDLDEEILGDLQTIELRAATYDVIYCSYLLEHINGAEEVLQRLFKWLKADGLLVLLIPDRDTVLGLFSRLVPLWGKVLFYKYVRKDPAAGTPGHVPFPTYYDKIVSRRGIHQFCRSNGHTIVLEYADRLNSKRLFGAFYFVWEALCRLIEIASLKKLSSSHISLIYVIRKSPR